MTSHETSQLLTEKYLPSLELSRLGETEEAGLWITSLPWPRDAAPELSLNGRPTHTQPLGQWPGEPEGTPRRLLLVADGGNTAPSTLGLQPQQEKAGESTLPEASMELFERSPYDYYVWERHFLRVQHEGRAAGIALGLRTGGEVHWWEASRLVEVQRSEHCLTIEMGGAIPHKLMDDETFRGHPGLTNPFLHKHNWLNGSLFLRLHSNGVCEVYARHVNSKFVDDGLDLEDVVPVVGFRLLDDDASESASTLAGAWDGSREEFTVGAARFDVAEVARLATPDAPGRMDVEGDFLVWQPYEGFELFGGTCPRQLIEDDYILRKEKQSILRGMSRTLRFSFSLSGRSPRVVRYLAPSWWYGLCEEFSPAPYLPVSNAYDETLDRARRWARERIIQGGFEDGSLPRMSRRKNRDGAEDPAVPERNEPGWEGEIPHGQFLAAWRSGEAGDYEAALRSAYHFTDLAIDHASKIVRMHGYPPVAYALPMARLQGTIAAYLETGDPFLLQTAEAVTANSYWLHKNSWPRMAIGRDACFIRSAVLLYRYFNHEYFRKMAHDSIKTVAEAQREDGSFGDQGGGTGLHQWGGFITKPWMAMLGTAGVLDYLEMFPDDEVALSVIRKTADWLMDERIERDGIVGWCYQHGFNGGRTYYDPFKNENRELPCGRWHQENIGRILLFCTQRFNDPAYADAWALSYGERQHRGGGGDHYVSSALQYIPWIQDHLWRAELTEGGVRIDPTHFGARTPSDAVILSPLGDLPVGWNEEQTVSVPDGVLQKGQELVEV